MMRALHMFKRGSSRFGDAPQATTPYQKAAQVWDERMGSARVQARNWRLIAFGAFALLSMQGAALIWQMNRATITPYVVEVSQNGEVRAVGAAVANWHPDDAQIAQSLGRFISQVRGLSSDPIVVRQNWLSAYDLVTAKAAASLNAYAASKDPFKHIGRRTVSVEITSVVRAGPASFELRWMERVFEQGRWTGDAHYTAILGIILQTPTTEEAITKNPLGLYINDLNWSKDLASSSPKEHTPNASTTTQGDHP
jgi:type IV secretion system protein TrbF